MCDDHDDNGLQIDQQLMTKQIDEILVTLIGIEKHIEDCDKPFNDEYDNNFLDDIQYSLNDVITRWE